MLISQPVTRCLTNHSELCMSRLLNNQSRRISVYRLQWRPSFGFEISVSSPLMTSGDPVRQTILSLRIFSSRMEQVKISYHVYCADAEQCKQGLVYDCPANNNRFHLGLENWLNRTEHSPRSKILGRSWLAGSKIDQPADSAPSRS